MPSSLTEEAELHAQNTGPLQLLVDGIPVEMAHTRAKALRMRVTREGTLKVSVPSHVSFDEAKRLVEANIGWAKERIGRMEGKCLGATALTEAAHVLLWGKDVPFKLVRETERKRIKSEYNESGFVIHAPTGVTEDALRGALDKLLAKELESRVLSLAPTLEARVGRHAHAWRYRRMVSRWGSCNVATANITLNIALAELDPAYLSYVMCHELCHLWERGHNQRFYARLEAACPDWKRLRDELKRYVV